MKTAYPNTQTTCKIRLYSNIPFDNTYKHHTLLSRKFKYNNTAVATATTDIKERFLDRRVSNLSQEKVYPRYDLSGDFNFDFSNGLNGSVTLELTPAQTNANYMRLTCGTDVYYYFITSIKQENFDTYTLTLELDVIMTYQDEFLDGMKDMPVMTKRKHCHQTFGTTLHCEDYKSVEGVFSNVAPSFIYGKINLTNKYGSQQDIEGMSWLYVCMDADALTLANNLKYPTNYSTKKSIYPLCMLCVPLGVDNIRVQYTYSGIDVTYTADHIKEVIKKFIGSGKCHGCKISNYPPFTKDNHFWLTTAGGQTTLNIGNAGGSIDNNLLVISLPDNERALRFNVGNNVFVIGVKVVDTYPTPNGDIKSSILNGCFFIQREEDFEHEYEGIILPNLNNEYGQFSGITGTRGNDPKVLLPPFTRYILKAVYNSEGYELRPELRLSDYLFDDDLENGNQYDFSTITTSYIGDNSIFTFLNEGSTLYNHIKVNEHLKLSKIGLSGTFNYFVPSGTDALDVFSASQQQAFYTSKVASGITSGLTIAGGIGAIAGGILAGGLSAGSATPMSVGMITGGVTAIASGTHGIAETIYSSVAKMEDLNNTPNNINISGSSFIFDTAFEGSTEKGNPYLFIESVNDTIREKANDFFYEYGYEVVRCCYFNTELMWTPQGDYGAISDTNLFTRTIFNYIEVQEDLVNKINADIPLIVKKKLSDIFNAGITLWTFYGFNELYTNNDIPENTYKIDKWFLKTDYMNGSYEGNYY